MSSISYMRARGLYGLQSKPYPQYIEKSQPAELDRDEVVEVKTTDNSIVLKDRLGNQSTILI
jgi:hypothetical protein